MYENRTAAGRLLGEQLLDHGVRPDIVLAIPSGGIAVARPIADRFDAELGVMAAESIRADARDFPIGAVTDTGETWIDDRLVDAFGIDDEQLDVEKQRAFREARNKHETYDEIHDDPTPAGTVVVVDEGVVSGTATKACLSAMNKVEDCYAVAAAPVGPPGTAAELHALADEVVIARTPATDRVIGPFYEDFERHDFVW